MAVPRVREGANAEGTGTYQSAEGCRESDSAGAMERLKGGAAVGVASVLRRRLSVAEVDLAGAGPEARSSGLP